MTEEEFWRERQERQKVGCPVPPILTLPAHLLPRQSPPIIRTKEVHHVGKSMSC